LIATFYISSTWFIKNLYIRCLKSIKFDDKLISFNLETT
jgi:hypothetical protein